MLIKKICALAIGSAIVFSTGAVVSFLSSNNTIIPEPEKITTLEPINENKPTEFKFEAYKSLDALDDFGSFGLDDFDLEDIKF